MTKREVTISVVYAISIVLLTLVDWRLVPAITLFGWAMNMENHK